MNRYVKRNCKKFSVAVKITVNETEPFLVPYLVVHSVKTKILISNFSSYLGLSTRAKADVSCELLF